MQSALGGERHRARLRRHAGTRAREWQERGPAVRPPDYRGVTRSPDQETIVVLPLDRSPPEPEPPEDRSSKKESHDDVEDACDGCGATGVPLQPVESRSARGGRFEMLLCPKCRRRL
jgi:hypothetical protein